MAYHGTSFEWDGAIDRAQPPRVYRVIQSGSVGGRPVLRIGGRIGLGQLRRAVFPPGGASRGVFVLGSEHAAREVVRHARLGGTVTPHPPHGAGLPHLHVEDPSRCWSEHVFYGRRVPSGDFLDAADGDDVSDAQRRAGSLSTSWQRLDRMAPGSSRRSRH